MADSSLDDFFAKKDKSKKKTKSKVTPGDILSKQEKELSGSKKEKKKKDKEKQQNSEGTQNTTDIPPVRSDEREEEEWVDFEQETEKDYTGLRIQNLQISKDEQAPEEENKESGEDEDEHDENGERKESKESGPWNKSQGQQQQQASAPAAPVAPTPTPAAPPAEEPKEAAPAKTPAKYVPPGARAGASSEPTRPTPLRKKRLAPNLHSEEDFPTLGGPGGNTADLSDGRNTIFEKVQSGGRNAEDPNKLQSLSLGNKFSALQD